MPNPTANRFIDSIRGRLFLTAAAVALPAIFLASWLVIDSHRGERELIARQLQETARALSLVVDRQLGQAETLLDALATSPAVDAHDWETLHRQAREVVRGRNYWIVLTQERGRHIMNSLVPFGAPLPMESPQRDYEAVLNKRGTVISDLHTSIVQGGPVIRVSVPVSTDEGGVPYALSLVMPAESLANILADHQFSANWIASIVDGEGLIVARSRQTGDFVGKPATEMIRTAVKHARHGMVEGPTLDGDRVVAAFHRAPDSGWTVVVGAPRQAVYASAGRLMLVTLGLTALILAIGFAAALWSGRGVVGAMEVLAQAATAAGQGAVPANTATGLIETDAVALALRESTQRLQQREAQLRQLNENLEEVVQTRTRELAEANATLAARNLELNDFAHVASHDLQEPLRQMRSFASIIQTEYGDKIDDTGRSYLERITRAGERMSRLIRDLLAYSKIAHNGANLKPVDLNRVVAEVTIDLESRLRQTGGKIEVGPLPVIPADPTQMHQLFLNLIGNALKFHQADLPPLVEVKAEIDKVVKIAVIDNGIGFDSQHADRIFAPFQRLHGRETFEGTGIGLAIVRRIAHSHGGTIAATSSPGQGSRFELILPRQEAPAAVESAG